MDVHMATRDPVSFEDALNHVLAKYDPSMQLKELQNTCLRYIYNHPPGECDVLVSLPTGYGKSVIFHLLAPLLRLKLKRDDGSVLVVCPLNLIQADQLRQLNKKGIRACRLSVGCKAFCLPEDPVCEDEDKGNVILECDVPLSHLKEGFFDIIFCHPEALFNTTEGQELLDNTYFQKKILSIVIDECHTVDTWSQKFRTAFKSLSTLPTFFSGVPFVGMSGTLTENQFKQVPQILGMSETHVIKANPDRPNIFLEVVQKSSSNDVYEVFYDLLNKECERLHDEREEYPVTLIYLPLEWNAFGQRLCKHLFSPENDIDIHETLFSSIYSTQAPDVLQVTISELKKQSPRIRLVFCSPAVGMGFDSPSITRVLHYKPPRSLTDYFQQIGRAGRSGQKASAVLYYNKRDIAKNLPGIQEDIIQYCTSSSCLRRKLLGTFGFQEPVELLPLCKCCAICKPFCECDLC